jgi:type I restriction enzyme R subunit
MTAFTEHSLELAMMELFEAEGYTPVSGDEIHREKSDVLLDDDLRSYLSFRYAKADGRHA